MFSETYTKIKQKAKTLNIKCDDNSKNTDIIKSNIGEAINSGKKKVKFEKSLNKKPTGKIHLLCHILNLIVNSFIFCSTCDFQRPIQKLSEKQKI